MLELHISADDAGDAHVPDALGGVGDVARRDVEVSTLDDETFDRKGFRGHLEKSTDLGASD